MCCASHTVICRKLALCWFRKLLQGNRPEGWKLELTPMGEEPVEFAVVLDRVVGLDNRVGGEGVAFCLLLYQMLSVCGVFMSLCMFLDGSEGLEE